MEEATEILQTLTVLRVTCLVCKTEVTARSKEEHLGGWLVCPECHHVMEGRNKITWH